MALDKSWVLGCAFCVTILFILLAIAVTAFGVAQIAIGAAYISECPKERAIPIFLIISGISGFFVSFVSASAGHDTHHKSKGDPPESPSKTGSPFIRFIQSMLMLFTFAWFIYGNVIVFRNYRDYSPVKPNVTNGTDTSSQYCNPVVMNFAFATIIITYVLLGSFIIIGCCACCCLTCIMATLFTKASQEDAPAEDSTLVSQP